MNNRQIVFYLVLLGIFIPFSYQQSHGLYLCEQATLHQKSNTWQCNQCYNEDKDSILSDDGKNCSLKDQTCKSGSQSCPIKNCADALHTSTGYYCSNCHTPYISKDRKCQFNCQGIYVEDMSDCACQVYGCTECEPNNPQVCKQCHHSTPLNVAGRCFESCPPGTFTNSDGTCGLCPNGCQRCSSATDCQECQNSVHFKPPMCACPNDKLMIDGYCVDQCPFTTIPYAGRGYCKQLCDQLFPEFNLDGTVSRCDFHSDEICYYASQHLKENLRIQVFPKDDYIVLEVAFIQTPNCFSRQLSTSQRDLEEIDIRQDSNRSTHVSKTWFKLPLREDGSVEGCSDTSCGYELKILWKDELLYNFKVVTQVKASDVQLTNIFEFSKHSVQEVDVVCTDCVIPKNYIEASELSLICAEGQACTNDTISVSSGEKITFTQKVLNLDFKESTLIPHSLRIDIFQGDSETVSFSIYLKEFTYNNEIKGEITYSFVSVLTSRGKLIVTSDIKDANILLVTEGSKVRYPQTNLGLLVNNETKSTTNLRYIIGGFCLLFLGVAIGIFLTRKYKSKQDSANETQYIIHQQEESNSIENSSTQV